MIGEGNLKFLVEFWMRESGKDHSRKDAKGDAKPAGSEQLAAGSDSDYKQTVGSWHQAARKQIQESSWQKSDTRKQ